MSRISHFVLRGLSAAAAFTGNAVAVPTKSSAYGSPATSGQVAFKFPLENGFPDIKLDSAAAKQIAWEAHGTLPNTPLPTKISDTAAAIFQVIALQEIFEVAYFQSLVNNITDNVPGFAVGESTAGRSIILDALRAVVAQEEIHALGVNAILATAGRPTTKPCQFKFPATNFDDAIAVATTFGDLTLGILQEVTHDLAAAGDTELVPLISSVIGQEGEQNGFYRFTIGKMPSALPFLTAGSATFGVSALVQNFIVPGSCPSSNVIVPKALDALTVITSPISECTTEIQFSIKSKLTSTEDLHLVYINQQNAPVAYPLKNVVIQDGTINFSAPFEYSKYTLNGLTIAAVTNSTGPFANATEVAQHAAFGPGLIEIN